MASRKNRKASNRVARGGAAAFAMGLFLAGPQAAGVAAADSQDEGSSATSSAAESAAGSANRASAPRRGVAAPRRGAANHAGSAAPDQPVTAARGSRGTSAEARADVIDPDIAPPPAATTRGSSVSATPAPAATTTSPQRQRTRLAPAPTPGISIGLAAVAPSAAVDTGPDAAPAAVSPAPAGGLLPAQVNTPGPRAAGTTEGDDYEPPFLGDDVPSWLSSIGLGAPSVRPKPASLTAIREARLAQVNGSVRTLFTALFDALDTIPANGLRTNLEGALLLLRRSIFNQNAVATPIQTSYDPTNPSAGITGGVEAVDPEGEAVTYKILGAPQWGTVVLDARGGYLYSPGKDFAGEDTFTVEVTSEGNGINLFGLGRGRSTQVVVRVGTNAPTSPFDYKENPANTTLFMNEVPVAMSVSRDRDPLGYYKASVTVKVAPDSPVEWAVKRDADEVVTTKNVSVPISKASAAWDSLASSGKVRLGVDFTLPDGKPASMIMTSVTADPNSSPGAYTFSGYIAGDPTDGSGIADSDYDVVGNSYNGAYDNFRSYYNVPLPSDGPRNFNGVKEFYISAANVYADTWTKKEYSDALKEAGPPSGSAATSQPQQARVRPAALKAPPADSTSAVAVSTADPAAGETSTAESGSAGEGPLAENQMNAASAESTNATDKSITQVISSGTGMVILRADGEISLWTPDEAGLSTRKYKGPDGQEITSAAGQPSILHKANEKEPNWKGATIAPYKDGFVVALRDGSVWQWTSGASVEDLTDYVPRKTYIVGKDEDDKVINAELPDKTKVIAVNWSRDGSNSEQSIAGKSPYSAIDNDLATATATSLSNKPFDPGAGKGSGLIIDLGQPMIATGLKLTTIRSEDTSSDPLSYQVYGADELLKNADNTDSTEWTPISDGDLKIGTGQGAYVRPVSKGYQDVYETVSFTLPKKAGAKPDAPDPTQLEGFQFYKVVFPTVRDSDASFVKIAELELPGYLPEPSWQKMATLKWPELGPNLESELQVSTLVPFGRRGAVAVGFGGEKGAYEIAKSRVGGVKVYDPDTASWKTLVAPDIKRAVTTMIAFKDGLLIGDESGHVRQWTGQLPLELGQPGNNLTDLTLSGPLSGKITAIMPYGAGFVAGTDQGELRQWTGIEWSAIKQPAFGFKSIRTIVPYEHGFVVGSDRAARSLWWTGTGWVEVGAGIGAQFGDQAVNAMAAPEKNGIAFGLKNPTKGLLPAPTREDQRTQVLQWRAAPVADVTDWLAETDSAFGFYGDGAFAGPALKAFDNNPTTSATVLNRPEGGSSPGKQKGFAVDLGGGAQAVVTGLRLTLTPGDSKSIPTSYQLQGANPGDSKYTLISSGNLDLPTVEKPEVEVAFANSSPYQLYQLAFPSSTDPENTKAARVAEIALVGSRDWARLPYMPESTSENLVIAEGDVTAMIDFDSGLVVGLQNGAVNRWIGGDRPQKAPTWSPWVQVKKAADPDPNFNAAVLSEELKFGLKAAPVVSEDGVFNDEDPMFGQPAFQPRCAADSSCDGKFYSFNVGGEAKPLMILGKEAKLTSTVGDVTTELSFDAGTNWRGYVFVPSGLWRKLNPDEYTAASVMAVTAGPSMSVTLGGKGTTAGETPFTIAEQELVNLSYDIPGAISFQFGAGVDASLTGKVKTSKPLTAPLTAHAYYTAGVLSTFNTAASDGFDFSFKSYPDIENGFTTVESVTFAPEVVPYVSAKVGMFTPSIPILGQFSVFDAGAKFENPLGANLTYKTKPGPEEKSFSVELYSEGNLDFGVHVLPFLTNELSYDDKLELYKVSGQFT